MTEPRARDRRVPIVRLVADFWLGMYISGGSDLPYRWYIPFFFSFSSVPMYRILRCAEVRTKKSERLEYIA